ncbi:TonB-dependent receptor [Marinobacterium iners]|nr:TonB-dependent receptor [Marinobacterium iners]
MGGDLITRSLKAEKAHNFELGMDLNHGSFDFGAGLYHSKIANPIAGATPWSKVAINLEDDIVTRGYYLRAGYAKGPWEISAEINIADTEFDDQTVTRYVYSSGATSIGNTLALDVNYQARPNLKLGWTAEFVRGMESFEINVAGEQLNVKKPGYAVHDVYAHWLPTGRDTFVIGLSINNLFEAMPASKTLQPIRDTQSFRAIQRPVVT